MRRVLLYCGWDNNANERGQQKCICKCKKKMRMRNLVLIYTKHFERTKKYHFFILNKKNILLYVFHTHVCVHMHTRIVVCYSIKYLDVIRRGGGVKRGNPFAADTQRKQSIHFICVIKLTTKLIPAHTRRSYIVLYIYCICPSAKSACYCIYSIVFQAVLCWVYSICVHHPLSTSVYFSTLQLLYP